MELNYTERDIEKATRLKVEGFNWIATNKNGRPFAYGRMPYRCADDSDEYNIWDNQPGTPCLMLSKDEFTSITWENEPVYIDEIITGVKAQANEDTTIDRLTAENAELRARLENAVELPCKAGDTVYCIRDLGFGRYRSEKHTVCGIVFDYNNQMHVTTPYGLFGHEYWTFNVDCFIDRIAAEAHLAELVKLDEKENGLHERKHGL